GPDEDPGRTAEQDRPDRTSAGHATRHLDELAERRPELDLVGARTGDVAGQAEELGAGRDPAGADRRIGLAAQLEDERHVGQRLDVVDDGRLAEQPDLDRERWLVARLAALALDRFEEGGL